jgi:Phage Tail Collar Domain
MAKILGLSNVNAGYMLAPSLQQGFIDKDSGLELAFGYVIFYRDVDHSTLKPVFEVGGPPDDPVYTELPNPLFLSAIGTFQDPNTQQDIIPYYYPFDNQGNPDLYYIEVYNAQNVLQFTRDHYPTIPQGIGPNVQQLDNFLPNGQFLMHLNLPNSGLIPSANEITDIAYGNWKFSQTPGSSSVNYVTFIRYNAPSNEPDQNPRYACQVQCTMANPSDSEKQIYNVIENVNFMQGQAATFQIAAYSTDGNNHNCNLLISKHFGAGGSPLIIENVATFTVTPEIQNFTINFTISSNIGKTLGPGDADSLHIEIQSPLSSISTIIYTDVMFVAGTFDALVYPPTPPGMDIAYTLGSSYPIPAYDGSDSLKFVQLGTDVTTGGLGFQYYDLLTPINNLSQVLTGMILPYGGFVVPAGYLQCNGNQYSMNPPANPGITQYKNLYSVINYNFGSGSLGFFYTFNAISTFPPPPAGSVYVVWNYYAVSTQGTPNAGTSGFTFTLMQNVMNGFRLQIYQLNAIAGSSIANNSYFILPTMTGSGTFYQLMIIQVNGGSITIPSVAYDVYSIIPIASSNTASQVCANIAAYANGVYQVPDLRGYYMRFWNDGAPSSVNNPHDPNAAGRQESGGQGDLGSGSGVFISGSNFGDNIGSLLAIPVPGGGSTPASVADVYVNAIIKT